MMVENLPEKFIRYGRPNRAELVRQAFRDLGLDITDKKIVQHVKDNFGVDIPFPIPNANIYRKDVEHEIKARANGVAHKTVDAAEEPDNSHSNNGAQSKDLAGETETTQPQVTYRPRLRISSVVERAQSLLNDIGKDELLELIEVLAGCE